jgi:hypothetical protein
MTANFDNARAAGDGGEELKSVPLKIRLTIAAIFVVGVLMVSLPWLKTGNPG